MKILRLSVLCVFIFLANTLLAQQKISGQIFDAKTKQTLPFVNITYNATRNGTAADVDGRFNLSTTTPITSLTFSFIGYQKLVLPIHANTAFPLKIYLTESTTQLNEITVVAGLNPAHRIIKNAVKNRGKNNPTNLDAFTYESYNKLIFTLLADSILQNSTRKDDSALLAFTEKQHLFLMESVSERQFKKPGLDNERITANRVSGLKNPTFALLASQFQSFSFYEDYITVLDKSYLNPITEGSTRKYLFILQDSVFTGTDTTFVISFEPLPNYKFEPLKGVLYINSSTWAVQNVIAEPLEVTTFSVKIQQRYEKFAGNSWFPVQLNYDFTFANASLNGAAPVGIGRTYLKNIQINPPLNKKDFSPIALTVTDDANNKPENFWQSQRVDSITEKETTTYQVIDSLGEAHHFEAKLKWLTALSEGKIRLGYFDVPLNHLLRYNLYEGIRLGFGAESNSKLLSWFKIGGYGAYGFGDKVWKYGYYGEFLLNDKHNIRLGGGYRFDIFESGGDQWIEESIPTILDNTATRFLWIQQFDQLSEAYAYLTWHPLPQLHARAQISRQNRYMPGDYYYETKNAAGEDVLQNGFLATLAQLYVQYAPNDKYMQGPFGRKPITKTFPVFTAQYSQALPDILDGTLEFKRIEFKARHGIKTKIFGKSTAEVKGGKTFGDAPYPYLFAGRSTLPVANSTDWKIYTSDYFSFETMRNNEFLNDQFVQLMFRQNFESRFFRLKSWAPQVEWLISGMWGTLQNPENHTGFDFSDTHKGYYETGLEIHRILGTIGFGAYYRFGPYQLPENIDNWAFKLTVRFAL